MKPEALVGLLEALRLSSFTGKIEITLRNGGVRWVEAWRR